MLAAERRTATLSDSKASSWNTNPSAFWKRFAVLVWVHSVSALCITLLRHFWSRDCEIRLTAKTQTHAASLLVLLLAISYWFLAWEAEKGRLRELLFRSGCPSACSHSGCPYTSAIEPESWAVWLLSTSTAPCSTETTFDSVLRASFRGKKWMCTFTIQGVHKNYLCFLPQNPRQKHFLESRESHIHPEVNLAERLYRWTWLSLLFSPLQAPIQCQLGSECYSDIFLARLFITCLRKLIIRNTAHLLHMLFLTPKLVGLSDRREITVGSTSDLQVIKASLKPRQITLPWIII